MIERISRAFRAFRDLRRVCFCGMMIAVKLLLDFYVSFPLMSGQWRLSFGMFAVAAVAVVCGPAPAALMGYLTNELSYFLKPTGGYFPFYGITWILVGVIYGLTVAKQTRWPMAILGQALVNLVAFQIFNTLWLSLQYGTPYFVSFWSRLPWQLIKLAFDVPFCYFICRLTRSVAREFHFPVEGA